MFDASLVVQLVTAAVAVLGIIWHQQHTTDKVRDELSGSESRLRAEFTSANSELRGEFTSANSEPRGELAQLRASVASNGERLARMEGLMAGLISDRAEALLSAPDSATGPPSR